MRVSAPTPDAVHSLRSGSPEVAWAARALLTQGMPPEEISAVLGVDDPVIVHRYLALHRERLEEGLADRLRALDRLEGLLTHRPR